MIIDQPMHESTSPTLLSAKTIAELFDTPFRFAIPPYQRAYSWGEKQLAQFLLDLKEQPPGKPYFLGHFLFERDAVGATELFVIDGQQRLTTVIIFFSCLLREIECRGGTAGDGAATSLPDGSLRERYLQRLDGNRLQTVLYDNAFFSRVIIDGFEAGSGGDMPRSQRLLRAALDTFTKALREAETPAMLATWQETIETAVVTTFEVRKKVQATQIFTFQNDRGIKPTNLEKLKAFLMHKVYLHSANRSEEEAIRDIETYFAEIYKLTERLQLDEDQVLNHHCTAFLRGWEPALDNVRIELKREEQDAAKVKWIKEFCHDLQASFQHAAEIEKRAERECALADVLILDAPNCWPLLLKLFRFHGSELGSGTLQRILRLMEITLFKMTYSTGAYRSNYFPHMAKSYDGKDAEALKNTLEWHGQNGFKGYWAFNDSFKAYLNGHHHYTMTTRYLLWKHENELRKEHRNEPFAPLDFLNTYGSPAWNGTIDHVMPQNPNGLEHPQEYQERYLHNLGNLVLMNLGKNASASNNLPKDKVGTLSASTHQSHRNVAETIGRNEGRWTEADIEARKQEIIAFALERWEAG